MSPEEEKRKAEIMEEIRNDERFVRYLKDYEESSASYFIEKYAQYKADLEVNGNFYLQRRQEHLEWLKEQAFICILEIQQKKLFDLECLWRAEKISLPGIEVTMDFRCIADNIMDSNIPEPISLADIALYQEFLVSPYACTPYRFAHYPYYVIVKDFLKGNDEDDEIPPYYKFHFEKTGSKSLLTLPDIRGEKEGFYLKLAYNREPKNIIPQPEPVEKYKPSINLYYTFIAEVAEKMGDKKFARYVRNTENDFNKYSVKLDYAFEYLFYSKDKVTIESCDNWKEALYLASKKHENRVISELLPQVMEKYTRSGLKPKNHRYVEFHKKDRDQNVLKILEGRTLNGEPRDLNF